MTQDKNSNRLVPRSSVKRSQEPPFLPSEEVSSVDKPDLHTVFVGRIRPVLTTSESAIVLTEADLGPKDFEMIGIGISPDQLLRSLSALAEFYRACGGVGLAVGLFGVKSDGE